MTCRGTIKGRLIELDEPATLPEGTRVVVTLAPERKPRRGSPEAVLRLLAGTLTHEEAELIRKGAAEARKIDPSLWEDKGQ